MPRTFDQVHEGDTLPEVKRTPLTDKIIELVDASGMGAAEMGAAGMRGGDRRGSQFADRGAAERLGLAGPIVPGSMKQGFLDQYLRRWLGSGGVIRRLQLSYRRPDQHNVELTMGGTVTRKYEEDGHRLLDIELWIDNPQGERSVRSAATVELRD